MKPEVSVCTSLTSSQEKVLTYDREVQCNIMDSSMMKHLQTIKEEEEHSALEKDYNLEM